jgi:glyoxylase-like metal-dependent hydrolase (beta-lactamase superfamily II)
LILSFLSQQSARARVGSRIADPFPQGAAAMTPRRMNLALLALCAAASPCLAGEIADGIHLLPGRLVPGSQPDGNTVILEAPDGLIVVDTGRHPAHTQTILDFASRERRPVVAVVNTHWHLDHIGGNPRLRRAYPDVRIWASDALAGAMNGFLADYRNDLEGALARADADSAAAAAMSAELAILDAGAALAPDEIIAAPGLRAIAGRDLCLGLEERAVTAGDVWLYDPATRVLIAGDLVTLPVPLPDTACPRRWQAELARLAAIDFKLLIPGHGPVMDRDDFARYRTVFANLLDHAAADSTTASCADHWLRDIGPLVPTAEHAFARTLLDYYVENHLRPDPARDAASCAD